MVSETSCETGIGRVLRGGFRTRSVAAGAVTRFAALAAAALRVARRFVFTKEVEKVVGAADEVDGLGGLLLLLRVGLLDLGVLEEELLLETESLVFAHRLPHTVTVLPHADKEANVVVNVPLATPGLSGLDIVDREDPFERIFDGVDVCFKVRTMSVCEG
jgi:hypothetical protein